MISSLYRSVAQIYPVDQSHPAPDGNTPVADRGMPGLGQSENLYCCKNCTPEYYFLKESKILQNMTCGNSTERRMWNTEIMGCEDGKVSEYKRD
jgi:hypothetical protein